MTILVTADTGLITADGGILGITGPTLAEMKAEIADDLARDDLTSQIASAITKAIRHYQSERFFFNEKTFSFPTVAGQAWYGDADHAYLPNLYAVDCAVLIDGDSRFDLIRVPDADLERVQRGTETGQPAWWSYFDSRLRLYPTPSAAYTVEISAHVRIDAPSTDTGTNAWMDEAAELIASRAKWRLAVHTLKDPELRDAMVSAVADALSELKGRTNRSLGTGAVRAYNL